MDIGVGGGQWLLKNIRRRGLFPDHAQYLAFFVNRGTLQPYGPLQHWHESKRKLKISSVEYQPSRPVDVLRTWETIMNPYIAGDIKAQYNQRQTERRQRMSQWETPTPTPQPLDDHHDHGGDDDPYGDPLSPTGGDDYTISLWGSGPSGPRGVKPTAGWADKSGSSTDSRIPGALTERLISYILLQQENEGESTGTTLGEQTGREDDGNTLTPRGAERPHSGGDGGGLR